MTALVARLLLSLGQGWSIPDPLRRFTYYQRDVLYQLLRLIQQCGQAMKRFVQWFWASIPDYLPFYLLLIVALYAAYKGRKSVTVISPFHLPPDCKLPFGEHTVANLLQDAFVTVARSAEEGIKAHSDEKTRHLLPGLEGLKLPEDTHFEVPTQFTVEVKGLSHEALISLGRKVFCKEQIISGDVVGDSASFSLMARSGADLWSYGPCPANIDGLRRACHELALIALNSINPLLLAAYEISEKNLDGAHGRLHRLMPARKKFDKTKKLFELAATLRTTELIKQGKFTEALNLLKEAAHLLPKSALMAYDLGVAHAANAKAMTDRAEQAKEYREAIKAYEKALELNPDFPEALNNLGVVLVALGADENAKEAIEKYNLALTKKPGYAAAFYNWGNLLRETGDLPGAIEKYQGALNSTPNDPDILYNLGYVFNASEQYEEAIESYRKALEAKPDDADILHNLGISLFSSGQKREALATLYKARQLRPDDEEIRETLESVIQDTVQEEQATGQEEEET
jgi:tetratricopeptide (TPR) repeat protein